MRQAIYCFCSSVFGTAVAAAVEDFVVSCSKFGFGRLLLVVVVVVADADANANAYSTGVWAIREFSLWTSSVRIQFVDEQ